MKDLSKEFLLIKGHSVSSGLVEEIMLDPFALKMLYITWIHITLTCILIWSLLVFIASLFFF